MRPARIGRPRSFDERVAELDRHTEALRSALDAAEQRITRLEAENANLALVIRFVPHDIYVMASMCAHNHRPPTGLAAIEDQEADVNTPH